MQSITPPIDMDEARRARGSKVRLARVPIRRALQRHCAAAAAALANVQTITNAMGVDVDPDESMKALIGRLRLIGWITPDNVAVALNRRALKHETMTTTNFGG